MAPDWTAKKLDVLVDVPQQLSLEHLRSAGPLPDEQLQPEEDMQGMQQLSTSCSVLCDFWMHLWLTTAVLHLVTWKAGHFLLGSRQAETCGSRTAEPGDQGGLLNPFSPCFVQRLRLQQQHPQQRRCSQTPKSWRS